MLSIVVPAYNEGEHIYDNLMIIDEALKAFTSDYEIIAVNDGSRDNTGAEIKRAAADNPTIKDFGYDDNRGKGGAVTWGAVNSKGDIVGFIDADLDLSPKFLGTYYATMTAEDADIVLGSKMHKDSKLEYPFARKVFSFCPPILRRLPRPRFPRGNKYLFFARRNRRKSSLSRFLRRVFPLSTGEFLFLPRRPCISRELSPRRFRHTKTPRRFLSRRMNI